MDESVDARSDLSDVLLSLQNRIENLRSSVATEERIVIALAGVPGSGKSTISSALIQQLHSAGIKDVSIVPMVSIL